MRRILGVSAAIAAIAAALACSSTLQIDVGFNQKADFSAYKTWAWKDDGSIRDPIWKRRVHAVFEDELAKHGLT